MSLDGIGIKTYINHLNDLKNDIYKILPLYEEKNEFVLGYIETLSREVFGLNQLIDGLPHSHWYIKTLTTLEAMAKKPYAEDEFKKVRKDVFKMLNAIDKEISGMEG